VLRRADELNVLQKLSPALKSNGWLAEKFEQARELTSPKSPPFGLYLTLMAYRLTEERCKHLISYLRLPKPAAQTLIDTIAIKNSLQTLANSALSPSGIYRVLHGYSPSAIMVSSLACDSEVARRHMELYLSKLRYVKPALNGTDLIRMGITAGPRIKEVLRRLQEARLDGKVTSKQGEEKLVKDWAQGR